MAFFSKLCKAKTYQLVLAILYWISPLFTHCNHEMYKFGGYHTTATSH